MCRGAEAVVEAAAPSDQVKTMEDLKASLERSERCLPSDLQGWAAQLQIMLPVCVMLWTPQCLQDPQGMGTWSFGAPRLAALAVGAIWHALLGHTVLSPLPYAVLALQLVLARPLWGLAILATAVNQRSLENLVHEASHFTLFRSRHLQTLSRSPVMYSLGTFFSWLIFRDVASYRASHKKHHGSFGDRQIDPDTVIYDRAQVSSWTDVLRVTAVWYWENVTCAVDCRPVMLLSLAAVALGMRALSLGWWPVTYLIELCTAWLVAYFAVLPPLRMIAEHEEHNGLVPEGELAPDDMLQHQWALTWTNDGLLHRWVFHPCGDGYHSLHHLTSRVPFFRVGEVHRELLRTSPIYRQHCQINTRACSLAFRWQASVRSQ